MNRLFITSLFVLALFIAVPFDVTHAQLNPIDADTQINTSDRGFIPCSGVTCSACDLVSLANTIIDWLIGFLATVFAVVIVVAGIRLATSGGNESAKSAAKSMLTNALIGFLIVLGAWLLIDTVLRALVGDSGQVSGRPWGQIECWDQVTSQVVQFDREELSVGLYALQQPGGGGIGDGTSCVAANSGPCSVSALQQAGFGSMSVDAAKVVAAESQCGANAESGTDRTTNAGTYSVGMWQINLAVHSFNCNGVQLNCPAAFRDSGKRHPKFNTKMYTVVDMNLYNKCVTAYKDPMCNSKKAAELARDSGDLGDWACSAKKCGVSTTRNNKCPL